MEGTYTKRQVIIPEAKQLYPWFKWKGFKVLIRDELYACRKLYSELSEAFFKTRNIIVLLSIITVWFEFNVAAMEGIYTKRQVIIPVTKKLYPWFKWRGFKVLIRNELYACRKLYSGISEAFFKTWNIIVLLSNDYCVIWVLCCSYGGYILKDK